LSSTLEETLALLDTGMTDREVAARLHLSPRTIEDHKRKILETLGISLEASHQGFAQLAHELGIRPGDLVNDRAGSRSARGIVASAMPWRRQDDIPKS
jgi:FixJ family two-component response regulator